MCECGSDRILSVSGKTSDMCFCRFGEAESDGYVPGGIGIGSGDYIELNVCMDCGQVQGSFPVSDNAILNAMEKC
jgi:hypothetical protein